MGTTRIQVEPDIYLRLGRREGRGSLQVCVNRSQKNWVRGKPMVATFKLPPGSFQVVNGRIRLRTEAARAQLAEAVRERELFRGNVERLRRGLPPCRSALQREATLLDAWEAFHQDIRRNVVAGEASTRSLVGYSGRWHIIEPDWADRQLVTVEAREVEDWLGLQLTDLGKSPRTVNDYRDMFVMLFNAARRHGLYSEVNPIAGVVKSWKKRDARDAIFLTPAEGAAIAAQACKSPDRMADFWTAFVWVLLLTGFRFRTVALLMCEDIRWAEGYIRPTHKKCKNDLNPPITEALARVLLWWGLRPGKTGLVFPRYETEEYLIRATQTREALLDPSRGAQWVESPLQSFYALVRRRMRLFAREAGLANWDKIACHTTRYTFGALGWRLSGGALTSVAQILGQGTIGATRRYTPSEMTEEAKKLVVDVANVWAPRILLPEDQVDEE